MSELNEKIFSEFLEVIKRVNIIEQNQSVLITKHNDVLERTNKILSEQNNHVQTVMNDFVAQYNRCIEDINAKAIRIVTDQVNKLNEQQKPEDITYLKRQIHQMNVFVKNLINGIKEAQKYNELQFLEDDNDNLNMRIEETDLTVRTKNCLSAEGIQTIGELIKRTDTELYKITNLGRKSLVEIKLFLQKLGLSLRII